jgi:hypothetical protein
MDAAADRRGLTLDGARRSAETWSQRGRRSWRLDGHKLDRQRDWLGVSNRHSTPLTLAMLESS